MSRRPISGILADVVVRHPRLLVTLLGLLTLGAAGILATQTRFDSDILNLLPSEEPAVQGLRDYERGFTQSNELAFVLHWKTPPEDPSEPREAFAEALTQQPWVRRVMGSRPFEGGAAGTREILVPLLLNLPPEKFQEAMEKLAPSRMDERVERLAREAMSGSPRALFELENDPTGLGISALEPLWKSLASNNAFDLTSPDGSLQVIPCVTRQSDISPEGCRELMENVHAFIEATAASLGPGGPEILVTGRAAYVAEISTSMERDIKLTSLVSLVAVVGLFWLGFRRLIPLIGIAILLAVSAVIATAAGSLIFGSLNVVAIGFCSILFGLGDDFSLLICQRFYRAADEGRSRRDAIAEAVNKAGPGILWVALTTAAGFLALCFAGSSGFRQLGALVAIGVLLATGIMLLCLPLFLHGRMHHAVNDSFYSNYARACHSHSRKLFLPGAIFALLAMAVSLSGWRPLAFDLSPASLEPTRTPAAKALALMMERLPDSFEPVIAVLRDPDPVRLKHLERVLAESKKRGLIVNASSPTALVLSPEHFAKNREVLVGMDWKARAESLRRVLENRGLDPSAFEPTFQLLRALASPPSRAEWSDHLPESSAWWFLVDRMVAPGGHLAAAQIQTPPGITPGQRLELGRAIASVPGAAATGWSQTLAALVPWARGELITFGGLVLAVISAILLLIYRDWKAWGLHMFAMVASMALTAALLKIFQLPINILNVLSFPLILGVGVDYGTHILLAVREGTLSEVLKPVLLSGLTTVCGFGALVLAVNPALSGLGAVCAIGVFSSLILAFLVVAPGACLIARLAPRASDRIA